MNKLLLLAAIPLLTTALRAPAQTDRDRLLGAWKLVSLEQPASSGTTTHIDCCGQFLFTPDGHLAVQVMEPESAHTTATAYAQGGYEASFGTYTLDEKTHTFTFHVEGALVRSLVGKDLPRAYQFNGNRLIITSTRPNEHWRVIWQRD